MRAANQAAGLLLAMVTGIGPASAEPGGFFKNLFSGGGSGGGGEAPAIGLPQAQDPNDVYCPTISVIDGGAVLQSFAGAAGDNSRLRHQIVFSRMSRECALRPDGTLAVKVGVEVRAMLGPAGAPGRFDAPLMIAITNNDKTITARTHRLAVTIPSGSAQGTASVIEDGLIVPADMAQAYDIAIGLGAQAGRPKAPPKTAAKRKRPATDEATATSASEAPVAGQ